MQINFQPFKSVNKGRTVNNFRQYFDFNYKTTIPHLNNYFNPFKIIKLQKKLVEQEII